MCNCLQIKPDYRVTIYWRPNNITDEKRGDETVTYYDADPTTHIWISRAGVSLAEMTIYEVK